MQKKIIALAVAAAFSAPAFADTTVYGVVDAGLVNNSTTDMKSTMVLMSGVLSSSRIGVKAVEDLNNGMKAVAVVEYALDTSTSSSVGNARQEMLAVAGDFGTVAAGYLQTTGYDWQVKFDPTAGSQVSPLTRVNNGFLIGSGAAANRLAHAIAYISPDMNGLSFAVNYDTNFGDAITATASNDNTVAGNKTTATMLSATYAAGPLVVGGVYAATSNGGNGYNKTSDVSLGASYDLGVAKLMATYQTDKVDNGTGTDKAASFSAVAPVGPGAVVFSYAKNTIGSTAADDNANSFTVAYLQGLSKTTTAYGAVHKISTKVAGGTTSDTTLIGVGLNKKF
jgi:predicted porin